MSKEKGHMFFHAPRSLLAAPPTARPARCGPDPWLQARFPLAPRLLRCGSLLQRGAQAGAPSCCAALRPAARPHLLDPDQGASLAYPREGKDLTLQLAIFGSKCRASGGHIGDASRSCVSSQREWIQYRVVHRHSSSSKLRLLLLTPGAKTSTR